MINHNLLLTALVSSLCTLGAYAQEDNFDLSSQRSEKQNIERVPGKKVDHQGIVINPTPHYLDIDRTQWVDLSKGVKLQDKSGKFTDDLRFLSSNPKGTRLTITFGEKQAQKAGLKKLTSGAYLLKVDSKGISITGYDERGAFYAIQTMKQIMESKAAQGRLPYLTCNDYPDLPLRGVVEGFYGNPWSHQVRLSLINYYGRNKMNQYVYGPKDDPYHSSPNWRLPYPAEQAQNIHELVEACRRNRVDFVWAIHPGKDIQWNEEDYNNLVNKFEMMYELGVRSFAIHFDDIEGEGTNPKKQVDLLNRLTREFVKQKGDVAPLVVCPTDYSQLWANPKPDGPLAIYGQELDPSIRVFWTGEVVCSDLTPETLSFVDQRIKRPAYYWWNFPVTDYARHIIMQGPAYGLDPSLTEEQTCGVLSNPMEHGEASKLALYGVADYNWNVSAYNAMDNWERALEDLTPEAHDAYRTFAIHSCDTETGYRRDESWETSTFRVDQFTQEQYDNLYQEFEKVEKAPAQMEANCKNTLLLSELRPWLTEFEKLGKRGLKALRLIKLYQAGDNASFWNAYIDNTMSAADRKAYEAHKSGTMTLQPFYETAMDDMASGFYKALTGYTPAFYRGVGTYPTVRTTQSKLMFDHDATTYYHSGTGQNTGDWVGADLGDTRQVREIHILQGRNSTDDVDYYDNTILECSVDGKTWKPLTDPLLKTYDIRWKGEPVDARYIRIRKLASEKKSWLSVREFEVNPTTSESLGFEVNATDTASAMRAFDQNPCTYYTSDGQLSFGIAPTTKAYTMLLDTRKAAGATLTQYDKKGKVLSTTQVDQSFFTVKVDAKATKALLSGALDVYEIIPQ